MVYVSKHAVAPIILRKIKQLLSSQVTRIQSREQAALFMSELLGRSEQLMLAKRLAVLVLLEQGYTYKTISRALKVTEVTISKYDRRRKTGAYNFLLSELKKVKNGKSTFWDELEKLLQAGLPPQGRGRWEHVFRND